MTSRRAQILVPLLVILASAAVYLPSLSYGFVYDDPRQIEIAAPRYTWAYVPSYFTSDVWGFVQQEKSNYYRPVFLIWLLLNYQAFGNVSRGRGTWPRSLWILRRCCYFISWRLGLPAIGSPRRSPHCFSASTPRTRRRWQGSAA